MTSDADLLAFIEVEDTREITPFEVDAIFVYTTASLKINETCNMITHSKISLFYFYFITLRYLIKFLIVAPVGYDSLHVEGIMNGLPLKPV
jgi:hypothetical protein